MASPSEKLAASLQRLHALQENGAVAIRSADLTRTHRERLCRNGFLREVIKGWYLPIRPDEPPGDTTSWYSSYWAFVAGYLRSLKQDAWCLSPEQSLSLHAGNWTVPQQLVVRAARARNNVTKLPHGTSLLVIRSTVPEDREIVEKQGLRLFSPTAALASCAPAFFRQSPSDLRTVLSMVRDASEVLPPLLDGGRSTVAGRLAGAFRNAGKAEIAEEILRAMRATGYDVRENDPFETTLPAFPAPRQSSALVHRIRWMWEQMRGETLEHFPPAPGRPADAQQYLQRMEENYVTDAYHSLSIEGYRVGPELIERVRSGHWKPDGPDREHRNTLAARGYWLAYQAVRESIGKVLAGEDPAVVTEGDHRRWYREMFAPSVEAGLLRTADLAGYRNGPVFIRGSRHVPPAPEALREAMPALFSLLRHETHDSVRSVLGHFIFVLLHPYPDGNGRMGRFLMNVMLAGGGYPWTVVPMEQREAYMSALEEASVRGKIAPFARLIAGLAGAGLGRTSGLRPSDSRTRKP